MWEMYLFTFVLLSPSSNTQGTFGKINEKDGQLWGRWHKRDVESKLASLVGRGKRVSLSSENSRSKNLQGAGASSTSVPARLSGQSLGDAQKLGKGL